MPDTTDARPEARRKRAPVADGEALLLARTIKGMTHREVAAACALAGTPVDYGNLGRAERNEPHALGRLKLPVLADVLGVHVTQILAGHPSAKAYKEAVAGIAGIDVGKIREALAGRAA